MLRLTFWILIGIVLYTYIGYAILLVILNILKKVFASQVKTSEPIADYPEVTLLIAAYNEKDSIEEKMQNSFTIDYPSDKLKILWITDGSDDGTPEKLKTYPKVQVLHQAERKGKTDALNRAMENINTPFVIFSDANTMIARDAIKILIESINDKKVGCVAGAKHIAVKYSEIAAGAGEGAYWQYESHIKKLESNIYSTLGAAGELYIIRTALFEKIDPDIIIDDFVISLKIACKGYKVKYAHRAYAIETPSMNIKEELKRKIRIASGGFQTLKRFSSLFNIFKHGFLSFEFISHKVLRWTIVPWAIPLIFILNFFICYNNSFQSVTYNWFLFIQSFFYLMVLAGILLEKYSVHFKLLFLPYYLVMINYAQIVGLFRFLLGRHSVVWEKSRRNLG
jgi:cellulose synthase/poly-beta-1,6-N-acetylglucosamine synthase-like glycosyltransferase